MKIFILLYLLIITQVLTAQNTICFLNSNEDLERKSVIRYLMDAFELENPDIKVILKYYNEDDALNDILTPEDGISPNLIMSDSRLLYRLSYIKDIDVSLTAELMNELGSDMYKGARNAFHKNGNILGLPYSAWLQVLWYRHDWFKQKRLQPPNELKTILKAAETFNNQEKSKYGIVIGERNDSYLEQCFLHLSQAEGLMLQKNKTPYSLNREAMRNSIDLYFKLSMNSVPGKDYWRSRDFFFQDSAAMLFYSTFLMDDMALEKVMQDSLGSEYFEELNGRDYDPDFFDKISMVTSISGNKTSAFGSVSGIGIFKGGSKQDRENMKTLIRFLFRSDVYISWLHMSPGGMLPVNRKTLENDNYYRDAGGVFKRFGRKRIIKLVDGLENLQIINPEELRETPDNGYEDKNFLQLIKECIDNPSIKEQIMSQKKWIQ